LELLLVALTQVAGAGGSSRPLPLTRFFQLLLCGVVWVVVVVVVVGGWVGGCVRARGWGV
jgi:hypothetical protein